MAATFEFLPYLSQRKDVYSFNTAYTGKYTLSKRDYILPENIEYAIVNFDDYLTFTEFYVAEQYINLQKFFAKDKWGVIAAADSMVLFKSGEETNSKLYQILDKATALSSARFNIEDSIIMLGYSIAEKRIAAGDVVSLSLLWQCTQAPEKDYWLSFKIEDGQGNTLHQYNHPICYRIYPTFAWGKGNIIKENIWVLVPLRVKAGEVWVKMLIIDRGSAGIKGGLVQSVPVKTNMHGMFDSSGWINLGKIEISSD